MRLRRGDSAFPRAAARLASLGCLLLSGCHGAPSRGAGPVRPDAGGSLERPPPLPVQQVRAYPEASTGLFVSLADFEDSPGPSGTAGRRGFEQVEWFRIEPARIRPVSTGSSRSGGGGLRRFVVNITRTGVGALEAHLDPGAALVFEMPGGCDFSDYALLSAAIHSRTPRGDLRLTLTTDGAAWRTGLMLLKPGWNNVLVDIQRLKYVRGFDLTRVRTLRIEFPDAGGPVVFNLDDVLLINNRRLLTPAPAGVEVYRSGLDYTIRLAHRSRPVLLSQSPDGLWRGGAFQPTVQLAAPGEDLPDGGGEALGLMGRRKVGAVEVLEHNAIRVRIANVWYFPTRAGEWASLDGARRIRWEYTFYGDGRWVAHVELNNAGGRAIGSVRIRWAQAAQWAGTDTESETLEGKFSGIVQRWSCLMVPPGASGRVLLANYRRPGRLRLVIAAKGAFAPGDADRDGFDESQGCYFLKAVKGHCRFSIIPPPGGLLGPVFRVRGRWTGAVNVSTEGLAIRQVVRLADGSALFRIPGRLSRPRRVEVAGTVPLSDINPCRGSTPRAVGDGRIFVR